MATTAAPYGLLPINLIGGQSFTGGSIRDYAMTVNSATAIFKGDIVAIGVSSGGQPTALTTTPTTSTRGLVGVAVGAGVGVGVVGALDIAPVDGDAPVVTAGVDPPTAGVAPAVVVCCGIELTLDAVGVAFLIGCASSSNALKPNFFSASVNPVFSSKPISSKYFLPNSESFFGLIKDF